MIDGMNISRRLRFRDKLARVATKGGIIVCFVVALEIVIMISPAAMFFYSAFNPLLQWLHGHAATRWLTGFFLPHMVLPPTLLLMVIRLLGSGLFVGGLVIFALCAAQVYLGKLVRWGVASKGLYRYIHHPQYIALILWGIGMSILWPRFLVLASLALMSVLYYFLARDEEARMLLRYGEQYRRYRQATGMFLPLFIEKPLTRATNIVRWRLPQIMAVPMVIVAVIMGAGFLCRWITLNSLPLPSKGNITLLSIVPEDNAYSDKVLDSLLNSRQLAGQYSLDGNCDYLGYLMIPDYVMQGMIADTGGQFHLYHHHRTLAGITDWVLHPFGHIRTPLSAQMAQMHHVDPAMARQTHCPLGNQGMVCADCPYRRVILVRMDHAAAGHLFGNGLLGLNCQRTPVVVVDLNVRTGQIVQVNPVGSATAWKDVPTPAF